MTRAALASLVLLCALGPAAAQDTAPRGKPRPPGQPATGPGGRDYTAKSVSKERHGEGADAFYIFRPVPAPKTPSTIAFLHGWVAVDPAVYGAWIEHLARRGHTVIYPVYQVNPLIPVMVETKKASEALVKALAILEKDGQLDRGRFAIVGHSYGGVVAANLAARSGKWPWRGKIPEPKALFLVQPGDGESWIRRADNKELDPGQKLAARLLSHLEDPKTIPEKTLILGLLGSDDAIVVPRTVKRILEGAVKVPEANRNLIVVHSDDHGEPPLEAGHFFPLAFDTAYSGQRLGAAKTDQEQAKKSGVDALDFYGTWRLFDALLHTAYTGKNRERCLGDTGAQRSMGRWSDGTPVKEATVITRL